jgi:hypothetical protein
MARFQIQSISREKFLLVAANLLQKSLVEATRTQAKNTYKQLATGKTAHLATVQMTDQTTAVFYLSLSHSEFRGSINFRAFRASVLVLLDNIARALRDGKELRVFNALNGGSAMIFGITATTRLDDQPNVMVLAADSPPEGDATVLQLMYLDPAQFTQSPAPDRAEG